MFFLAGNVKSFSEWSLGSSGFPSSNEWSKATSKPRSYFFKGMSNAECQHRTDVPHTVFPLRGIRMKNEPIFSAAFCYHLEFLLKTIISSDFTLPLIHMLKGHRLRSGLRRISLFPVGFNSKDAKDSSCLKLRVSPE